MRQPRVAAGNTAHLLFSAKRDEPSRRIVNVADGVADSDAATVGQLEAVTQDTRYFAANGGVDSDTRRKLELASAGICG